MTSSWVALHCITALGWPHPVILGDTGPTKNWVGQPGMHAKNVRLSGNSGAVGMPGRKKIWEGSEDFSLLWKGTGWPHSGYVLLELHSVKGERGGHPLFPLCPRLIFALSSGITPGWFQKTTGVLGMEQALPETPRGSLHIGLWVNYGSKPYPAVLRDHS